MFNKKENSGNQTIIARDVEREAMVGKNIFKIGGKEIAIILFGTILLLIVLWSIATGNITVIENMSNKVIEEIS